MRISIQATLATLTFAASTIATAQAVPVVTGDERVDRLLNQMRDITIHIAPRQLQCQLTKEEKWVKSPDKRTLSVGASSRDLRLEQTIN